jgi:intracellular septation protein
MHKNVAVSWSIEFGPIVLFFISINILGSEDSGFLISTAIFTLAMIVALYSSYKYEKRVAWFPLIAGISVISFGLITLSFQKPIIFILKDTFYNGFFALLLLIGAAYNKALLKPLFSTLFDMSDEGWYKLSIRWGVFFLLLTIGNELVWRLFDQDVWVNYKFWSTILTTIFGLYQIRLSRKYRNEKATKWGLRI